MRSIYELASAFRSAVGVLGAELAMLGGILDARHRDAQRPRRVVRPCGSPAGALADAEEAIGDRKPIRALDRSRAEEHVTCARLASR